MNDKIIKRIKSSLERDNTNIVGKISNSGLLESDKYTVKYKFRKYKFIKSRNKLYCES